jgi:hypothetical protein
VSQGSAWNGVPAGSGSSRLCRPIIGLPSWTLYRGSGRPRLSMGLARSGCRSGGQLSPLRPGHWGSFRGCGRRADQPCALKVDCRRSSSGNPGAGAGLAERSSCLHVGRTQMDRRRGSAGHPTRISCSDTSPASNPDAERLARGTFAARVARFLRPDCSVSISRPAFPWPSRARASGRSGGPGFPQSTRRNHVPPCSDAETRRQSEPVTT